MQDIVKKLDELAKEIDPPTKFTNYGGWRSGQYTIPWWGARKIEELQKEIEILNAKIIKLEATNEVWKEQYRAVCVASALQQKDSE